MFLIVLFSYINNSASYYYAIFENLDSTIGIQAVTQKIQATYDQSFETYNII